MEIIISSKSKKPIYEQIASQIKQMIMAGQLQEGDSLPAMRSLAKSLRVSVITVQRTYEDLQREGFVDSAVGRGTFVAKQDKSLIRNEHLAMIEGHLSEVIHIAKNSGIELEEITKLLHKLFEETGG